MGNEIDRLVTYTTPILHVPIEEVVPEDWQFKEQLHIQEVVWDTLGEPSGKSHFLVKYTKPPSADIPIDAIIPRGWGDEDAMECFANYLVSENFWEEDEGSNLLTQELAKIWEISSDDEADDSVNHVTRSGKHYPDPPMPEREGPSAQDKGKQKVVEEFDEDAEAIEAN